MDAYTMYHSEIPAFLLDLLDTPPVRRLREVGMNCGCEYTAFPRFRGLAPYSRYDHSLGVALIVWHFTGDPAQAAAGLLHDIATPVFAHVVDFMRGDYLRQEATEEGTEALIAASPALQAALRRHGLTTAQVCDYHRYPIADNDTPRLSADRLEYTLGNAINFGLCSRETAQRLYAELLVDPAGEELAFHSEEAATAFADLALQCSKIYVSDEDRYAMQMLSELLRGAVARGVLDESDLTATEPAVIAKLIADPVSAARWQHYRAYARMLRAETHEAAGEWRRISAKKRHIDPLILGRGRVSACVPAFRQELAAFLTGSQDVWLCGKTADDFSRF